MADKFTSDVRRIIQSAIKDAGRYPFLFIGSGLSRRYMGTPGWEGLLREVCRRTLDDEFAFPRFLNRAKVAVRNGEAGSVYPFVATLMENEVNDAILGDGRFASFREGHKDAILSGCSPMKIFVADLLSGCEMTEGPEQAALSRAGRDKVSGVITTNYDRMCDLLFPSFSTFVGEDDLLMSEPSFTQEIYKIHGSIDEPDGMVLNEADYRIFSDKEKYLAAKLLTIFVEYPVIFIGYSIQDDNIKSILSSVARCMGPERLNELRSRLIFVQYSSHGAQDVGLHSISFEGQTLSMTSVTTDDFTSVFESISQSKRLYSTRFIKEMRGSVYQIAERVDPKCQIVVSGIRSVLDSFGPDDKVVVGLGVSTSEVGTPIHSDDLFEDVVAGGERYAPDFVVENYLEDLLKHVAGALPVFKYAASVTIPLDADRFPRLCGLLESHDDLDSFRNKSLRDRLQGQRERYRGCLSVDGLIEIFGEDKAYKTMWILEEEEIDLKALGTYLRKCLADDKDARKRGGVLRDTEFRRMVRIYDFLRYRKSPDLSH